MIDGTVGASLRRFVVGIVDQAIRRELEKGQQLLLGQVSTVSMTTPVTLNVALEGQPTPNSDGSSITGIRAAYPLPVAGDIVFVLRRGPDFVAVAKIRQETAGPGWANGLVAAAQMSGRQELIQHGSQGFTAVSGGQSIAFAATFPSNCDSVVVTPVSTASVWFTVSGQTVTGFKVQVWNSSGQVTSGNFGLNYVAVGH